MASNDWKKKQLIALVILYRSIFSDLTEGQRLRLQRSPKVKDRKVGLEIPAKNFRTNIATGKMFTPLCFFGKGTP